MLHSGIDSPPPLSSGRTEIFMGRDTASYVTRRTCSHAAGLPDPPVTGFSLHQPNLIPELTRFHVCSIERCAYLARPVRGCVAQLFGDGHAVHRTLAPKNHRSRWRDIENPS